MELFNKFRDTIFLKEEGNLEKQIEELNALPNIDENIQRKIKLLELGLQGEKQIAFELKHANIGMYVLHDIKIVHEDLTAQIDYVIITRGYIYLVECKNLVGDISVNSNGEFRREYTFNNRKYKEAISSPYNQAQRHKDVLKKQWLNKNNKLTVFLSEAAFDKLWYKPLVVLTNPKGRLDTKYAPKEIKHNIVRVDNLVRYIQNDLDYYDKKILSTQKEMLTIGKKFLEMHVDEYHSMAEKYKNEMEVDIENSNEKMIEKLKVFRKERSIEKHIPAYYIFTDEELDNIIAYMPKTVEELKSLRILSDVKVKCHGEEIVSIINQDK